MLMRLVRSPFTESLISKPNRKMPRPVSRPYAWRLDRTSIAETGLALLLTCLVAWLFNLR